MTPDVVGAEIVVDWFGEWPTFHDAEILAIHLNRDAHSTIRVHTWRLSSRLDIGGRFIREREGVVVLTMSDIARLTLEGEDVNRQNVIAGLLIERQDGAYRLVLSPSYGLSGEIVARTVRVHVEPLSTSAQGLAGESDAQ